MIEEAVGEDAAVMVFNAIAKDLPVLDNELPFFRLAMQALDKNYIKVSFD